MEDDFLGPALYIADDRGPAHLRAGAGRGGVRLVPAAGDTPFYEAVPTQVGTKRNWEYNDDLDMLFHGTYTADFYRMLRDILHGEVDAYNNGGGTLSGEWGELWAREEEFRNPVAVVG